MNGPNPASPPEHSLDCASRFDEECAECGGSGEAEAVLDGGLRTSEEDVVVDCDADGCVDGRVAGECDCQGGPDW